MQAFESWTLVWVRLVPDRGFSKTKPTPPPPSWWVNKKVGLQFFIELAILDISEICVMLLGKISSNK